MAATSGRIRLVRRAAHPAPTIATGMRSHSSTGKISSHRDSGVQAMSEVREMRARSGTAQKAAMANAHAQIRTAMRAAPCHRSTVREANTRTSVVRMCDSAVMANTTAAGMTSRSSPRTARTSNPR